MISVCTRCVESVKIFDNGQTGLAKIQGQTLATLAAPVDIILIYTVLFTLVKL